MEQSEQFRTNLLGKTEAEILAMFASADEYDIDALNLARLELVRRNLPLDEADRLEAAARKNVADKSAIAETDYNESYIERHWNGDLSLARSYWLNGFVVNIIFVFAVNFLTSVAPNLPLFATLIGLIVMWALIAVLTVWQWVGTWRSATRHLVEGLSSAWPHFARVAIVLGVFVVGAQFITIAIPQVNEFLNVLRGDPAWSQTRVTILPSGKEIEYSGAIRLGSANKLKRALETMPGIKILYLDTIGGRMAEAEEMVGLIRAHHLSTYVENECASAGVLLFLAGEQRIICDGARIGFHSASFPGIPTTSMNDAVIASLRAGGADQAFISKAVETSASSMWYPTAAMLKKQGVVTRTTNGSEFGLGTAKLAAINEKYITKELDEVPMYRALALKEPRLYSEVLATMVAQLKKGESWIVASREINELVYESAGKCRPFASADALDLYLDFMMEILVNNKNVAPRETLMMVSGEKEAMSWRGTQLTEKLPRYPVKADQAFITALLSGESNQDSFDYKSASRDAVAVLTLLVKTNHEAAILQGIPDKLEDQIRACEIYQEYYTIVRQLPRPRRTNIARYFTREE